MKSDSEWLGLDRQEDRYVQYEKMSINTAYEYVSQNESHFTCRIINGIARIRYFAI